MARSFFDRNSRVRPWLCLYGLIAGTVLMIMPASGQAVPAGNEAPQTAAKVVRPTKAEEHGATIDIADVHVPELVNQRGIEVFTTSPEVKGEGDVPATFGRIVIRNCEIGNLKRDEVGALSGVQVEGIRITGAGDQQAGSTDVVIEDVYLHDVQGMPIRIQDGKFGTITFRRVRIEQTLVPAIHVVFINSGSVERIQIEDSPGLVLRLMGRPGSVGEVATSGSPETKILDELSPDKVSAAADVVADAGNTGVVVAPVKMSANVTSGAAKPATTQKVAPKVEAAKPIEVAAVAEKGTVRVTVSNLPKDVSHVSVGVFDRFAYMIGTPVILTEAPWEATVKVGKAGTYSVRVALTRVGGDTDRPVEKSVEVR